MMAPIDDFNVFPLFPTTVAVAVIKEDLQPLRSIRDLDYTPANNGNIRGVEISVSTSIFDLYPREHEIIQEYFNRFKDCVLRLESMQFDITTSWATRLAANTATESHSHKNCFYSGVLYLDPVDQGGELEFENTGINPISFLTSQPTDYNIFNYERFFIEPKANLLVLFPSYLRHRVRPHTMIDPRYSIAFNIMPVGEFGRGDSRVNLQLVRNQQS